MPLAGHVSALHQYRPRDRSCQDGLLSPDDPRTKVNRHDALRFASAHARTDTRSLESGCLVGVGEHAPRRRAVIAGIWTLFNYYRNRRADAARWLQQLFSDFHLDGQFKEIRTALEYDYDSVVGPLVERRITDRGVPLSEEDRRLLLQLDTLLNYFEHVLYLEAERHLNTKDRQRCTNNWFEIMSSDHMAGLRRYAGRFGFKRVAHALGAEDSDYIVLYGSIRSDMPSEDKPDITGLLELIGPCTLPGVLYDLGDKPGLKLPIALYDLGEYSSRQLNDDGLVTGELYRVLNRKAFQVLDEAERYNPHDLESSLYQRRCMRVREPQVDAWIYVYNRDVDDSEPVEYRKRHRSSSPEVAP